MLYHFSEIAYDYFLFNFASLLNPNDIVVMDRSVFGRIDMAKELSGEDTILKQLCIFSKCTGVTIIVAFRSIFEDGLYNSAVVIEAGKIVGFSDEIAPLNGYKQGNSISVYDLSLKKLLLIVGNDIFYQELSTLCLDYDASLVIHIDADCISKDKLIMAQAIAVSTQVDVYSFFRDASLTYDENGAVDQIEIGTMRRFNSMIKHKSMPIKRRFKIRIQK